MYTIKQASLRTGVGIPLLRAWERRYGIPVPERTSSGYRLYGEAALAQVRRMTALMEAGWAPRQAARAILEGVEESAAPSAGSLAGATPSGPAAGLGSGLQPGDRADRFVAAARALDDAALEAITADAFAALGTDEALERFVMPALVAVGEAWSRGDLDVAGEHAASSAVMRRLGALFEAAAVPSSQVDLLVGLPPDARHEAGALAFAVAARRAGLRVLYLGADVPLESWLAAVRAQPRAAVVMGAVTHAEAESAARVAAALRVERAHLLVAVGGAAGREAARGGALILGGELRYAVAQLRRRLAGGS
jgi:DNA-binding transcriptional MerR regulator/methylmalonyl-CoA mutase cobalamin-binding subunit